VWARPIACEREEGEHSMCTHVLTWMHTAPWGTTFGGAGRLVLRPLGDGPLLAIACAHAL
jgi:hypothetical protein